MELFFEALNNFHRSLLGLRFVNQSSWLMIDFFNHSVYAVFIALPGLRIFIWTYKRGSGSSVGIVTELRAGRSGIESRWGRVFPPPARTQPPVKWVPCLSPGVKCGRGVLLTTHSPSSAAVMEK